MADNGNPRTPRRNNRTGSHPSGAPKAPFGEKLTQRLAAMEKQSNDTSRDLAEHKSRYTKDIESVRKQLGLQGTALKVVDKKHESLARLVAELGKRVATNHDAIVAELKPRLDRLQELVDDGTQLKLAAAIAGFGPEEIKEILDIQAEDDLDDSAIATGMIRELSWLKANVKGLTEGFTKMRGDINSHGSRLNQVETNVRDLTYNQVGFEREFDQYREGADRRFQEYRTTTNRHINERFEEVRDSGRFPMWGFIAAIVVGLIVGLWVNASTWTLHGDVLNGNGTTVGTFHGSWHHSGVALLIGILAALFVLFVVSLLPRRNRRRHTEQHTERHETRNNTPQPAPTAPEPHGATAARAAR